MSPMLLNPFAVAPAGSAYAAAVLADSPLAYWRQGDASGSTMTDSSGNARHGNYVGPPTLGQASLLPNDADTSVLYSGGTRSGFADPSAWANTANLTAEAWINPTSLGGSHKTIVQHDDVGSSICWRLFLLSSGEIGFYAHIAGSLRSAFTSVQLSVNTTHHIVATFDGSTMLIYIDKVQRASTSISGSIRTQTAPISIGCFNNSIDEPFTGRIDEVAIYDHAITSTRVAAHYDAA